MLLGRFWWFILWNKTNPIYIFLLRISLVVLHGWCNQSRDEPLPDAAEVGQAVRINSRSTAKCFITKATWMLFFPDDLIFKLSAVIQQCYHHGEKEKQLEHWTFLALTVMQCLTNAELLDNRELRQLFEKAWDSKVTYLT